MWSISEPAVGYHELLVGAEPHIAQHDCLGFIGSDEITRGKNTDARDLEIGRNHTAVISGGPAGQMLREHPRLLISWLDQPVTYAPMLGAFAECKDVRCTGLQVIANEDAAINSNARVLG